MLTKKLAFSCLVIALGIASEASAMQKALKAVMTAGITAGFDAKKKYEDQRMLEYMTVEEQQEALERAQKRDKAIALAEERTKLESEQLEKIQQQKLQETQQRLKTAATDRELKKAQAKLAQEEKLARIEEQKNHLDLEVMEETTEFQYETDLIAKKAQLEEERKKALHQELIKGGHNVSEETANEIFLAYKEKGNVDINPIGFAYDYLKKINDEKKKRAEEDRKIELKKQEAEAAEMADLAKNAAKLKEAALQNEREKQQQDSNLLLQQEKTKRKETEIAGQQALQQAEALAGLQKIDAEKQANLAKIQAEQNKGLALIKGFFTAKNMSLAGGVTAMACGSYFGFKLLQEVTYRFIIKPKLVKATSIRTVFDRLGITKQTTHPDVLNSSELKYNPEIRKTLNAWSNAVLSARKFDLPYPGLMLYGPPGTGKTSTALAFARDLQEKMLKEGKKIDYVLISGAAISQFEEGKDVQEIFNLFKYLKNRTNDTIVIVEEADAAFRSRNDPATKEKTRIALNAWLEETGTESKKIGFVYLTNLPQTLDAALKNRVDVKVHLDLPGTQERHDIITMFINKWIRPIFGDAGITEKDIDLIAEKTAGLSGRSLSQVVRALQSEIALQQGNKATPELLVSTVDKMLAAEKEI